METKLIESFERIQAIPYRCRAEINMNQNRLPPYANCNQKRNLLIQIFKSEGFEARELDAIFDWRDLPLPSEILSILKKSGTLQKHHLLEVKIGNDYFKIDSTWNLELEELGFPVTRKWDRYSDTVQITSGDIKYFIPTENKISLPYFYEERIKFANELNEWIGWKK
jgi:hypothetical protein